MNITINFLTNKNMTYKIHNLTNISNQDVLQIYINEIRGHEKNQNFEKRPYNFEGKDYFLSVAGLEDSEIFLEIEEDYFAENKNLKKELQRQKKIIEKLKGNHCKKENPLSEKYLNKLASELTIERINNLDLQSKIAKLDEENKQIKYELRQMIKKNGECYDVNFEFLHKFYNEFLT